MGRKLTTKFTTKEFIDKAILTHGDKYDYSEVDYKNQLTKVKIFCKKHKIYFHQIPKIHFTGSGCRECGKEKVGEIVGDRSRLTKEQIIERGIEVHGNRYDYSEVEYINYNTNIKIFCKKCRKYFLQTPLHHILAKKQCPLCSPQKKFYYSFPKKQKSLKITGRDTFIREAKNIHGNKYEYFDVDFKGMKIKIKIFCKKHKKYFFQSPYNHLKGSGCRQCGTERMVAKRSFSKEDFIKRAKYIHEDRYDYSKVKYINMKIKVKIKCLKHGIYFYQRPNGHLVGQGCPFCLKKYEGKAYDIIKNIFNDWDVQRHKKIWHSYRNYNHKRFCDFWLEKDDIKIMVEYDGKQHYMPVRFNGMAVGKAKIRFKEQQKIDKLDTDFCKENNIILHRIKYNEDEKKSIVGLRSKVDNLWN